jgi:hypothetical protein
MAAAVATLCAFVLEYSRRQGAPISEVADTLTAEIFMERVMYNPDRLRNINELASSVARVPVRRCRCIDVCSQEHMMRAEPIQICQGGSNAGI